MRPATRATVRALPPPPPLSLGPTNAPPLGPPNGPWPDAAAAVSAAPSSSTRLTPTPDTSYLPRATKSEGERKRV